MLKRLVTGLKGWLEEGLDMRRAPRFGDPAIRVYYWDGSVPEGRKLRDISETGAYIIAEERWYVGTVVRLILQEYKVTPGVDGNLVPSKSSSIPARVVRHGPDGVAVEFMFTTAREREALRDFLSAIPKVPTRWKLGTETAGAKGAALIEFALLLPLLFLLVVNAINFGGFLFAWITVANGARTGAQYMCLAGTTLGRPRPATPAQITALVTSDISSLLNRASLAVRVCTNTNGVISCAGPGSSVPAADPEATRYVLAAVDVSYTYQPYLPIWDFSVLGIHATLPSSTLHRQASMRMLQ